MLRRAGALGARLGSRSMSTQKAMTVEVNQQGVAIMRLNCPGEVQNTLSMDIINEFNEVPLAAASAAPFAARPRASSRAAPRPPSR